MKEALKKTSENVLLDVVTMITTIGITMSIIIVAAMIALAI